MRAILAVALLLTLVLAGCASKGGGGKDDDGTTPTGTASGTATGSGTSSASQTGTASSTSTGTGGPANRAPSGAIAVVLNGTSARFNLTGSDLDGDALSWTLDFGDGNATDGSSLPANVTHLYEAGNFTVVYNVTDGQATTTYNATIAVNATGGLETQAFSGNFFSNSPRCASSTAPYDAVPDSQGLTYDSVAVLPGTWGRPFTVTFASGAAIDAILFLDAADAVLLETRTGLPSDADWEIEGDVPAAAALVVFYGCATLPNVSDDVPPQPVGETFDYITS